MLQLIKGVGVGSRILDAVQDLGNACLLEPRWRVELMVEQLLPCMKESERKCCAAKRLSHMEGQAFCPHGPDGPLSARELCKASRTSLKCALSTLSWVRDSNPLPMAAMRMNFLQLAPTDRGSCHACQFSASFHPD